VVVLDAAIDDVELLRDRLEHAAAGTLPTASSSRRAR
jgi:hypothetical protein